MKSIDKEKIAETLVDSSAGIGMKTGLAMNKWLVGSFKWIFTVGIAFLFSTVFFLGFMLSGLIKGNKSTKK